MGGGYRKEKGRRKGEENTEKRLTNEQEPCNMEVTKPIQYKENLLNGNCPHPDAHCQP
jgi:hypothetical protein